MDRDLESEFNNIVEQYKISPFGFRLRKTGNILKLSEYNGLYYIDLTNIFKIVNELLGPNISEEIMEYINKITFSETISIDTSRGSETKTMTCIQFIDNSFFRVEYIYTSFFKFCKSSIDCEGRYFKNIS